MQSNLTGSSVNKQERSNAFVRFLTMLYEFKYGLILNLELPLHIEFMRNSQGI